MGTTTKLHLTNPMQPKTAIMERGFCGKTTRAVVGLWKFRAVLFVTEAEWAAMCLDCKARAAEWMKANDASTAPCFAPHGSIDPGPRQHLTYDDIRESYLAALGETS